MHLDPVAGILKPIQLSGRQGGCRAEPGMGENTEGRAGGLADYACGGYDRAERTQLICPAIISPG